MGFISRIVDWVTTPYTIYLIIRDPAIALSIKLRAGIGLAVIFAYIISPFDLVPDFIPLAGWLDDLIVVPLLLVILRKITPGIDVIERRKQCEGSVKRVLFWTIFSLAVAVLVGLAWLGLLIYVIVRMLSSG